MKDLHLTVGLLFKPVKEQVDFSDMASHARYRDRLFSDDTIDDVRACYKSCMQWYSTHRTYQSYVDARYWAVIDTAERMRMEIKSVYYCIDINPEELIQLELFPEYDSVEVM